MPPVGSGNELSSAVAPGRSSGVLLIQHSLTRITLPVDGYTGGDNAAPVTSGSDDQAFPPREPAAIFSLLGTLMQAKYNSPAVNGRLTTVLRRR